MTKTKVFKDTFKGSDCFAIWPVDENDAKVGNYPIISFGLKKAISIIKHLEELDQFVKSAEAKSNEN
jgi:hypothetical protein